MMDDVTSLFVLDEDGILVWQELLFCKHGILHGYHLCWGKEHNIFQLIINGSGDHPPSSSWHSVSLGSYFFKDNSSYSKSTAFIYPDLNTALIGNFQDNNSLVEAYEAVITSVCMNDFGIMEPKFELSQNLFVNEAETLLDSICLHPLQRDPYETKLIGQVSH